MLLRSTSAASLEQTSGHLPEGSAARDQTARPLASAIFRRWGMTALGLISAPTSARRRPDQVPARNSRTPRPSLRRSRARKVTPSE